MKKKESKVECQYEHAVTDYQDFSYRGMPEAERRKLDIGDIWSNKIQCKKCGWFLRSKNRHNFVTCKCNTMCVDGGSWYQRVVGDMNGYINYIEYYDDVKNKN